MVRDSVRGSGWPESKRRPKYSKKQTEWLRGRGNIQRGSRPVLSLSTPVFVILSMWPPVFIYSLLFPVAKHRDAGHLWSEVGVN